MKMSTRAPRAELVLSCFVMVLVTIQNGNAACNSVPTHANAIQPRREPAAAAAASSWEPNALLRPRRSALSLKNNASTIHSIKTEEKPSRNYTSHAVQHPMFTTTKNAQLQFDPEVFKCDRKQEPVCVNKTIAYRDKILHQFRKSLETCEACGGEPNVYNAEYEHPDDMVKYNPTCMVLDAKLRLLTNRDSPFDANKIGRLFPREKLFDWNFPSAQRSCIIVSSAGSLFRSNLGRFIGKTATHAPRMHNFF